MTKITAEQIKATNSIDDLLKLIASSEDFNDNYDIDSEDLYDWFTQEGQFDFEVDGFEVSINPACSYRGHFNSKTTLIVYKDDIEVVSYNRQYNVSFGEIDWDYSVETKNS